MMVSRPPGAPCDSVFGHFWFQCRESQASGRMTEIPELRELPTDGLESSWGALWLGIRTFFCFNLEYRRLGFRMQIAGFGL